MTTQPLTGEGPPEGRRLSVVIPCFNEQDVLPLLRERLVAALAPLGMPFEVVLVDDGSRDRTPELLKRMNAEDERFKFVRLSRNFGHQAAVSAGLTYAQGDVVAVMDADLQDPPEVLVAALAKWREGADVVYAVRERREGRFLLRLAYGAFYRLLRTVSDVSIPLDSGDFCVMDRRVVDVLSEMHERNMFVRGMRAWTGFRQVALPYHRPERAAGETKYPLRKLIKLAFDGILSFSTAPLRLGIWFGFLSVALGFGGIIFIILWRLLGFRFMGHTAVELPGWAAATVLNLFLGGVQLIVLGVIGEYVARMYDEVKRRPRWVVMEVGGMPRRSRAE